MANPPWRFPFPVCAPAQLEAWIGAPSGEIHIFARELTWTKNGLVAENNLIRNALSLVLAEWGLSACRPVN